MIQDAEVDFMSDAGPHWIPIARNTSGDGFIVQVEQICLAATTPSDDYKFNIQLFQDIKGMENGFHLVQY